MGAVCAGKAVPDRRRCGEEQGRRLQLVPVRGDTGASLCGTFPRALGQLGFSFCPALRHKAPAPHGPHLPGQRSAQTGARRRAD